MTQQTQTQTMQTKRIDSYSFMEFCQLVQEAIKDGYSFDFDSNENFPQQMGTFITCGLVKEVEAAEVTAEAHTEVEVEADVAPKATRGRKAKDATPTAEPEAE